MLLGVQWIDGQSSPWWRYTWRLWLAEFLWHGYPQQGCTVFLWGVEVSRCSKAQLASLKVSGSHAFSPTLWTVRSTHFLPWPHVSLLSGLLLLIESENRRNRLFCVSVLTFLSGTCCHRCRCLVSRGRPGLSVRRGDEREVLQISQISENGMRSVGHLGSHHTPIHGNHSSSVSSVPTLMYPGDRCFAVFVSRIFH